MSTEGVAAVIVAAGGGTRMGLPLNKVLLPLCGRPLLDRTLELFDRHRKVGAIVLVVAPREVDQVKREVVLASRRTTDIRLVPGGQTRHVSEWLGIEALAGDIAAGATRIVLVHDGARPFVTSDEIDRVISAATRYAAVVPAVRVDHGDLMGVTSHGEVEEAPARIWAVQTPQGFDAQLILRAHRLARKDGFQGVDTASVAEHAGYRVHVVDGSAQNFKITTREDLVLAEALLRDEAISRRLQL